MLICICGLLLLGLYSLLRFSICFLCGNGVSSGLFGLGFAFRLTFRFTLCLAFRFTFGLFGSLLGFGLIFKTLLLFGLFQLGIGVALRVERVRHGKRSGDQQRRRGFQNLFHHTRPCTN